MKIKEYVEEKICEKSRFFKGLEREDKSNLLLYQFFTDLAHATSEVSKGSEGTISREQLKPLKEKADKAFLNMVNQYVPEWFGGKHPMERKIEMMSLFYKRFILWYLPFVEGVKVLSCGCKLSLPVVDQKGESIILEDTVPLILEKGGGTIAFLPKVGKNSSGLGLRARKPDNKIEYDFRYSVIKTALEPLYPGINLMAIFFQEGESKGVVKEWVEDSTAKTNVATMAFEDCYEGAVFEPNICLSRAENVLIAKAEKPCGEKCENCHYKTDCQIQTFSNRKMIDKSETKKWQVPSFDDWQKKFVSYKEGKILVLAGPGSGKTASIIGRIIKLSETDVPSEKILCVTYTEKAAGEMKLRLKGHFSEDEMPKISTLHGIATEIINLYERANDLSFTRPLSKSAEKKVLKEVLDEMPQITGVSYRTYKEGKFNTISTVYNALAKYIEDRELFFSKHPDYIPSEWDNLCEAIESKKREGRYVSFDELLEHAADILKMDNTIMSYYHSKFDYIIVDEYQDANAPQDRLVQLLNGKGNLACVGDDDQSIFRFNGSSPEYVHMFQKRYPDSEVLLLPVNYRTTKSLVEFNNQILSMMGGNQRIDKSIRSGQYADVGDMPNYVGNNEPATIDYTIQKYIKKGYSYGDIAVVATTNKSLIMLNDRMKTPTELASAYAKDDYLFHLVKNLLSIVLKQDCENNAYLRLGYLFEKDEEWYSKLRQGIVSEDVYELVSFAEKQKEETPEHFVARVAAYVDMDESPSETAVLSVSKYAENLYELYETMKDMIAYGDEKKVEYPIKDCVTLITAHSCKGKEWPVVIVYDTEAYLGEISENVADSMDLRLFYVTASRAMKEVCFMKSEDSVTLLDTTSLNEKVVS